MRLNESQRGKVIRIKEYKSFYKAVGGEEGSRCYYNTRLDTYGCGCLHNCNFCYARSLLEFRNLWNPTDPSVADLKKIERKLDKIPAGTVLRLGGMTDCFQPAEIKHRITYETLKMMFERGIHALIVTKSDLVASDRYLEILDKDLTHIQISVTSTSDEPNALGEKASLPSKRIAAIEKLQEEGFDVAIRLSPFIPEFIDLDVVNSIKVDKAIVEFLRVNAWIKKWLDIDYSPYTLKQGGYQHLPLEDKINILNGIKIKYVSVCEDVLEHYIYWQQNFNPNKNDCCNLKGGIA